MYSNMRCGAVEFSGTAARFGKTPAPSAIAAHTLAPQLYARTALRPAGHPAAGLVHFLLNIIPNGHL